MTLLADVVEFLQDFAPLRLAADWDNVGLLLGDREAKVKRVMTCLTLTPEVAEEAASQNTELIVSHHPLLFRPTQKITSDTIEGRVILKLLQSNIAVYSPHTALDNTKGGINDGLAQRLGLQGVQSLRNHVGAASCKVVVFVPEAEIATVAEAMFQAGAGNIGQYSKCSFRLPGTGTFFGSESANPTVGQKGRLEEVAEFRLEAICPENKVDAVVKALRQAHSYEEPAYDVYALRPSPNRIGLGRVGNLQRPVTLRQLAEMVKKTLRAGNVQIAGDEKRKVQRIALACGAAGEFLADAVRAGADVFLTGEIRFHDCLAALTQQIAVLLPGHYPTERPGVEDLAIVLGRKFPALEVWASQKERDPLSCV